MRQEAGPALGTSPCTCRGCREAGERLRLRRKEEFASWEEKQGKDIQGQKTCVASTPVWPGRSRDPTVCGKEESESSSDNSERGAWAQEELQG